MSRPALLAALAALAFDATAATHVVQQSGTAFIPSELTVKVGDTVRFTNDDAGFHNVFSVSGAKVFDLGMFTQGKSKEVTFDEPGSVKVECMIHPEMTLLIDVEP